MERRDGDEKKKERVGGREKEKTDGIAANGGGVASMA